jgi:hypothetical protein
MKAAFSYVVLRYMHDVFTREFVNIGVLLYAPEARFLRMRRLTGLKRVRALFPGLQSDSLQELLKFLESRCREMESRLKLELTDKTLTAADIAKSLLTADDSSLQWSMSGGGVTEDAEETIASLFERMVTRHEQANPAVRRDDEDVWKPFERELRARHVLHWLQEKELFVGELHYSFKTAWQPSNSYLRIYQPLSFDLLEPSGIVLKAARWGALIRQLRKADPEFEINLLLGKPLEQSDWPAFEQATAVLEEEVPGRKELVPEEKAPEFAKKVEEEMKAIAA